MALVPLGPTSTRGVSFHYNDGITSFGVVLWSVFLPPWLDLVLAGACC